MIPTLYDKTGNNKIGDLNDCIECLVEEERNGIFELTMIYPANSSILESIVYDNIIVADANDYLKSQKFRVYNTRKLMANRIEVCARHISFDLVHDWVDAISIENQSCEYALNTIFRNSQFSKHFKGHSDIVNAQNFKVNKATCLEAIGGTSGSIIDTYGTGAEILRDNTNIHVLNRRGRDNDVIIEYRKNLTGLEVEEDITDLVTRIMPYATYTDENGEEIEVKGEFVDSPLLNNYAHPYIKYIDYSEKFEDGETPTVSKLVSFAKKEYTNNKVDIPKCNYKIEFIPLSKCAGYDGLEDRINLCDTVTVRDTRYNIDTQAKVIKVVFDVLRGRYDSMELGEPRTTLGDIIGGTGDGPTQGPPGPPGPPGPQGPAGVDGSIGDFPQSLPAVPQITAKVYGFANIEISWTFENKVYYSYELYASKTKGFVPNTFNLIFSGQASTYLYQAQPNETWYFRACALNTHGQRTEFSKEIEVKTVKISDLSNYVESAAIGDALIGELNLGRGWYGELRGNYIDAKQMSVTDGNGKRTLDIDSFGNVNLDVTSLKIRANSVATESFVTTAKNELNTAISKKANSSDVYVKSEVYTQAQTDSQINVVKDSINLGVSQTYETKANVETKINNIKVGATNRLAGTIASKNINVNVPTSYITWDPYTTPNKQTLEQLGFTVGDKVTVGFNWSISKNGSNNYTYGNFRIGFKGIKADGTDNQHLGIIKNPAATFSSSNTKGRVEATVTLDSNTVRAHTLRIRIDNSVLNLKISNVKLELGDKATSWSPAPEDTIADINDAKADAIASANNALITTIANYYTKEETESAIRVAKDEINLGVSGTYETKANVETKVTSTLNSAKSYADTKKTEAINTASTDATNKANNAKNEAINSANNTLTTTIANYYTKKQTDSAIKIAKDEINLGVSNTYETKANVETKVTSTLNSAKSYADTKKSEAISSAATDATNKANQAKTDAINSANNKLTTTIKNYYTKTETDSQINVAKNAITQSVANTYETKSDVTSKINGVNNSISSLTTRMTNAESKITDTAITNVVKQNFYTKTETNDQITSKGYQTASQVQQTVDSLQLKFTQSGGYNLIRNSKPEKNANLWISDSGISTTVNSADNCLTTTGWGKRFRLATTNSSPGGARSQRFDLAPNTKYTVSGWVYSDSTSNGAAVYLRTSNSLDAASNPTSSSYDSDVTILQTGAQASYKFFQKTITTGASVKSAFIKIVHRGSRTSGTSTLVAFNQLQIVEGEFALPWSPHPNEVYDGVTEIDKDGVRVSTNRGAYTQFGAEGMDSYDNQGNQTLGLRNGGLTFYASNNHEYVGYISQSFVDTQERNGVVIGLTRYGDYLALGTSEDIDPNQGFYRPSWILLSRYEDKAENINYGINMYQDLYMHDYSLRNSRIKYDGFKRNKNDYISFYTINSTSSSELNLELADDSSTYFNIQAKNYNDGSKYIARFNYAKGTASSNVGIHFYRALNCHGYNITNVGNMSVYTLAAEDLAVNDIRVAAPYALCASDGEEPTSLSVVKTVGDVTEANGVATVTNGRAEINLPDGLAFTDYYVHVTPNKVAAVAVTERGDSSFVIETNSEEEIEVFYTIKAFQPQRIAREAIYGELQGEDGTCTTTYEEEIK